MKQLTDEQLINALLQAQRDADDAPGGLWEWRCAEVEAFKVELLRRLSRDRCE